MVNVRTLILICVLLLAVPVFAQEATPEPAAVAFPEVFDQGVALFDAQQFEQAILRFDLFLLFNPTAGETYYATALSHLNLGDQAAALADFENALAIDALPPDLEADIYRVRAGIYGQSERLDDAISDYSAALEIVPDAQTYFRRAMVYAALNQVDAALTDFDSALELDGQNPVLYVYRGYVYSTNGDTQLAAEDYLTYINLIQTQRNEAEALESGASVTAPLEPGLVYAFPISVKVGTYFSSIALSTDDAVTIDTLLVLVDEAGKPIVGDDDSGSNGAALVLNFEIPSDGDYTLLVANSTGGGSGQIAVQMFLSEEPLTN